MEHDHISSEQIISVVDRINNHLVFDGLPSRLDHLMPMLHFSYVGGESAVMFCGYNIWDSASDSCYLGTEGYERFLLARIAEIRKVLNHATSGIPNSTMDDVVDSAVKL